MCRLSWNLGASNSWDPQGLSRPVMGLLYLCLTAFTKAHQWCLCWVTWIKSRQSHLMSLRVALIFSCHLCLLFLSSLLLPSGFEANIFFAFLFPPGMLHVFAYLIFFYVISLRIFCTYNLEDSHYADGQGRVVGLAACYRLDSSRFESWWKRDTSHPFRLAPRPT